VASAARKLPDNVPGDFFVDATCIDCGACRWIAPASFDHRGGYSRVYRQPTGDDQERAALRALVACPTGSIGAGAGHDLAAAVDSFPYPLAERVLHCGFHSEDSFGAASYLALRPDGNVLVDSPRWNRRLAARIEALGGARYLFLTHRDDVAEHARWAAHLGAERIIHARDRTRDTGEVERVIDGDDPVALAGDLTIIPTPGHTAGSACLLAGDALFTGDHLAWDPDAERLEAWPDVCWYDWSAQVRSMERLLAYRFAHVLPGHGAPVSLPAPAMHAALEACVAWMRQQ
jgi:glyoxylase-like metal-dependent hydrolase (beta-lactamase superfamily II)/ferredoxin